ELFAPAVARAREGYVISPRLAFWLRTIKSFANDPVALSVYYNPDGSPRKEGEPVVNPALADTLQSIADKGAKVLAEGALADEMVARVRNHVRPGTLSLTDLANYQPIKREALCGPYRVWLVCGMPSPSSGGVAILQILALLEPFELAKDQPNDLRSLHLTAETSLLAFRD